MSPDDDLTGRVKRWLDGENEHTVTLVKDLERSREIYERRLAELNSAGAISTPEGVPQETTTMPTLEAGDWFLAYGAVHQPKHESNVRVGMHHVLNTGPMLLFYGINLSEIEEIRKPDGRVWRRDER